MSRRSSVQPKEAEATVTETDQPVTTETPVVETVTSPDGEVTVKSEEAPEDTVDLTGVLQAAEAAVAARVADSTKDLDATATATEYQKLDRKGRTKALSAFAANAKSALMAGEMQPAIAWTTLQDSVKAKPAKAKAEKEAREPVNPTEAYVRRLAVIQAAYAEITSTKPDKVDEDWQDKLLVKVNELKAELVKVRETKEGDEAPELSDDAKAALKLASKGVKTTKSGEPREAFTGERRNVKTHIMAAFQDVDPGVFLSVSQIQKRRSDEYGDDMPSAGAISAALKSPKFDLAGIKPANGGEKNQYGAIKS